MSAAAADGRSSGTATPPLSPSLQHAGPVQVTWAARPNMARPTLQLPPLQVPSVAPPRRIEELIRDRLVIPSPLVVCLVRHINRSLAEVITPPTVEHIVSQLQSYFHPSIEAQRLVDTAVAGHRITFQFGKALEVYSDGGVAVMNIYILAVDQEYSRPRLLAQVAKQWKQELAKSGRDKSCLVMLYHQALVDAAQAAATLKGCNPKKLDEAVAALGPYYDELTALKFAPHQMCPYLPNEAPVRVVERLRAAYADRAAYLMATTQQLHRGRLTAGWSIFDYWQRGYDLATHHLQFGALVEGMASFTLMFTEYYNNSDDFAFVKDAEALVRLAQLPDLFDPTRHQTVQRNARGYPAMLESDAEPVDALLFIVACETQCALLLNQYDSAIARYRAFDEVTKEKFGEASAEVIPLAHRWFFLLRLSLSAIRMCCATINVEGGVAMSPTRSATRAASRPPLHDGASLSKVPMTPGATRTGAGSAAAFDGAGGATQLKRATSTPGFSGRPPTAAAVPSGPVTEAAAAVAMARTPPSPARLSSAPPDAERSEVESKVGAIVELLRAVGITCDSQALAGRLLVSQSDRRGFGAALGAICTDALKHLTTLGALLGYKVYGSEVVAGTAGAEASQSSTPQQAEYRRQFGIGELASKAAFDAAYASLAEVAATAFGLAGLHRCEHTMYCDLASTLVPLQPSRTALICRSRLLPFYHEAGWRYLEIHSRFLFLSSIMELIKRHQRVAESPFEEEAPTPTLVTSEMHEVLQSYELVIDSLLHLTGRNAEGREVCGERFDAVLGSPRYMWSKLLHMERLAPLRATVTLYGPNEHNLAILLRDVDVCCTTRSGGSPDGSAAAAGAFTFSAIGKVTAKIDEEVELHLVARCPVDLFDVDATASSPALAIATPAAEPQVVSVTVQLESRKNWNDTAEHTHVMTLGLRGDTTHAFDAEAQKLHLTFHMRPCHAGDYRLRSISVTVGTLVLSCGTTQHPSIMLANGGTPSIIMHVPEPQVGLYLTVDAPPERHCFADSIDFFTVHVNIEKPLFGSSTHKPDPGGATQCVFEAPPSVTSDTSISRHLLGLSASALSEGYNSRASWLLPRALQAAHGGRAGSITSLSNWPARDVSPMHDPTLLALLYVGKPPAGARRHLLPEARCSLPGAYVTAGGSLGFDDELASRSGKITPASAPPALGDIYGASKARHSSPGREESDCNNAAEKPCSVRETHTVDAAEVLRQGKPVAFPAAAPLPDGTPMGTPVPLDRGEHIRMTSSGEYEGSAVGSTEPHLRGRGFVGKAVAGARLRSSSAASEESIRLRQRCGAHGRLHLQQGATAATTSTAMPTSTPPPSQPLYQSAFAPAVFRPHSSPIITQAAAVTMRDPDGSCTIAPLCEQLKMRNIPPPVCQSEAAAEAAAAALSSTTYVEGSVLPLLGPKSPAGTPFGVPLHPSTSQPSASAPASQCCFRIHLPDCPPQPPSTSASGDGRSYRQACDAFMSANSLTLRLPLLPVFMTTADTRVTFCCMRDRQTCVKATRAALPFSPAFTTKYAFNLFRGRVYCNVEVENQLKHKSLWLRAVLLEVLDEDLTYVVSRSSFGNLEALRRELKPGGRYAFGFELTPVGESHAMQELVSHKVQLVLIYSDWATFVATLGAPCGLPALNADPSAAFGGGSYTGGSDADDDSVVAWPGTQSRRCGTGATAEDAAIGSVGGSSHGDSAAGEEAVDVRVGVTRRVGWRRLASLVLRPYAPGPMAVGPRGSGPTPAGAPRPPSDALDEQLGISATHPARRSTSASRCSSSSYPTLGTVAPRATGTVMLDPLEGTFRTTDLEGAFAAGYRLRSGSTLTAAQQHLHRIAERVDLDMLEHLRSSCNVYYAPVATFQSRHLCLFSAVISVSNTLPGGADSGSPFVSEAGHTLATSFDSAPANQLQVVAPRTKSHGVAPSVSTGWAPGCGGVAGPSSLGRSHGTQPGSLVVSPWPSGSPLVHSGPLNSAPTGPAGAAWGRMPGAASDVPWGVVFSLGEPICFHVQIDPQPHNWPDAAGLEERFFLTFCVDPEWWMVVGKSRRLVTLSLTEGFACTFTAIPCSYKTPHKVVPTPTIQIHWAATAPSASASVSASASCTTSAPPPPHRCGGAGASSAMGEPVAVDVVQFRSVLHVRDHP